MGLSMQGDMPDDISIVLESFPVRHFKIFRWSDAGESMPIDADLIERSYCSWVLLSVFLWASRPFDVAV